MGFFSDLFFKPARTTLTVTSSSGFHLRPAAQFASLAKGFSSDITAHFGEKEVNAKALNSLLSLGLEQHDSFTLQARGKDAQKALEALEARFCELMRTDREVETIEKRHTGYESPVIEGEIIARGIAIAPAYRYKEHLIHTPNDTDLHTAITKSLQELDALYEADTQQEDAGIYLAQKALLETISKGIDSLDALEEAIAEESAHLVGSKMEAKIADYRDILQRVKKQMGYEVRMILPDTPTILLAEDLLPSQIETLQHRSVPGVILQKTTLTSHTAILLRSAGIPALIADYGAVEEGLPIVLDADSGVIVTAPSEKDLAQAGKKQEEARTRREHADKKRFEKALTRSRKQIRVLANVTDAASAKSAKEAGAEGIGLLRTEFLFKEEKPSFAMQKEAYAAIFSLFEEVTVRTLDVGGDKKLPYLTLPKEQNPFLGIRGVRLFKTHPKLLEEQLHAIFAAAEGRPIKVMFPMVSSVEEFTQAKTFAQETALKHGIDIASVQFGIMVEVPSVLFLIPEFNEVVDFYSIGTNDLTQYLFAMERTHPTLRVDEHSPVVFDAIKSIVDHAEKPVSICGELAADPKAVPKLLKLGIETLSVSPAAVANTKEEIRDV